MGAQLEATKEAMSLKDQLSEFNKQRAAELKARFQEQAEQEPCYNTPAMQEVQDKRALRLSAGVESPINIPERSPSPDYIEKDEKSTAEGEDKLLSQHEGS